MNKSKECSTFIGDTIYLTVNTDKVEAVSLQDCSGSSPVEPPPIYRPLTKDEKWEVICLSFAYGSSGILYWAFKSLILWWTKDVYPQQGKPNKPRTNFTRMFPSITRKRH